MNWMMGWDDKQPPFCIEKKNAKAYIISRCYAPTPKDEYAAKWDE